MRKWFLTACAVSALAARAEETPQENMRRLFKESVQIHFKVEGLKRQVEAAVHDPSITSEAIAEARAEMEKARAAHVTLAARTAQLERDEKEVPQELAEQAAEAADALADAMARHRGAVMEHPKVKAL
ncbi:MAG: hypothetical protein FWF96_01955, partial [Kiritimatiellaeota bacterium]|nr:hypothetical protein [Kiritimatiellota bacterium]